MVDPSRTPCEWLQGKYVEVLPVSVEPQFKGLGYENERTCQAPVLSPPYFHVSKHVLSCTRKGCSVHECEGESCLVGQGHPLAMF